MKYLFALLLFSSVLIFSNCKKKGCTDPAAFNYNSEANKDDESCEYLRMEVEYMHDGINPPYFQIISNNPKIQVNPSQIYTGTLIPDYSKIEIQNFRIYDTNTKINYVIDSIKTDEMHSDWILDTESKDTISKVTDLSLVLVLDCSESLGINGFNSVKTYSKEFVNYLFLQNSDVKIGIVSFSSDVTTMPITNSQNDIINFIDNMQQGHWTSMYDAMDSGINMLNSEISESKVLVTFTDGVSNDDIPSNTEASIHNQITDPANKISSYTIGLGDLIDKNTLKNLVSNGGQSDFPANSNELKETFELYRKAIANIYTFKYYRSRAVMPNPMRIRFTFDVHEQ